MSTNYFECVDPNKCPLCISMGFTGTYCQCSPIQLLTFKISKLEKKVKELDELQLLLLAAVKLGSV